MVTRRALPVLAALAALLIAGAAAAQERQRLIIATGSVTGVYFAAGNAVCRVLERQTDNPFDCRVAATGGSGDNLRLLQQGEADLAMVQSDVLATRAEGDHRLALAAIYPEVFQVVVRRGLGMKLARDALQHRFNLGLPDSGTRLTLAALLNGTGYSLADMKQPVELSAAEEANAFCRGRIDGFAFVSGIPNSKIAAVLRECGGKILGFDRRAIAGFVRNRPGVDHFRFRRNTYPEMGDTLDSFAVEALLVAAPGLDRDAVRTVLTALLGDIDWFTRLHPAWADLLPADMALNIPPEVMHPDARAVYAAQAIIGD